MRECRQRRGSGRGRARARAQVAFIEELQRRLTPRDGALGAPGVSQSVPDLVAAVQAAEQREAAQHQQSPFELRALEVVLDVVRPRGRPRGPARAPRDRASSEASRAAADPGGCNSGTSVRSSNASGNSEET